MPPGQARAVYACDITYGTNAEFGFDYLRDNGMAALRGRPSPARPLSRHHRRSRLHPHRRRADATHHLRCFRPSATHPSRASDHRFDQLVKKTNRPLQRTRHRGQAARSTAETSTEPGKALFKLKLGQPRNRNLMRFMEESGKSPPHGEDRTLLLPGRSGRNFSRSRKSFTSPSTKKATTPTSWKWVGKFLSPGDPEAFTLDDLGEIFAKRSTQKPNSSRIPKSEASASSRSAIGSKRRRFMIFPSCSKPIVFMKRTSNTSSERGQGNHRR